MRISAHDEYDTNTIIQLFRFANTGRLNIYRKHSTKYETVATAQDKQVAMLVSNEHV